MIDKFNTNKTAELVIEGKKYSLPIIEGTEGEKAIDIRCLRRESGFITLDSGYMDTGSCASEITFLDGARSILNYRGYAIEDLAERLDFMKFSDSDFRNSQLIRLKVLSQHCEQGRLNSQLEWQ